MCGYSLNLSQRFLSVIATMEAKWQLARKKLRSWREKLPVRGFYTVTLILPTNTNIFTNCASIISRSCWWQLPFKKKLSHRLLSSESQLILYVTRVVYILLIEVGTFYEWTFQRVEYQCLGLVRSTVADIDHIRVTQCIVCLTALYWWTVQLKCCCVHRQIKGGVLCQSEEFIWGGRTLHWWYHWSLPKSSQTSTTWPAQLQVLFTHISTCMYTYFSETSYKSPMSLTGCLWENASDIVDPSMVFL